MFSHLWLYSQVLSALNLTNICGNSSIKIVALNSSDNRFNILGYQSSEYVPGGPGSLRNTVPNSSLLTIGALPALRSSQTMIEVLARGGTIETAAVPVATSSSAIGKSILIFQ